MHTLLRAQATAVLAQQIVNEEKRIVTFTVGYLLPSRVFFLIPEQWRLNGCVGTKTYTDVTFGNFPQSTFCDVVLPFCISLRPHVWWSKWTASLAFHAASCIYFYKPLSLNFPKQTIIQSIDKWTVGAGWVVFREGSVPLFSSSPGMKQVDGPLRSASAGTPRLHPQSFLQMRTVVSI